MDFDHIVMGLGNPGPRYAMTRHNAGFICLDLWAQEYKTKFKSPSVGLAKKINAELSEIEIDSKKVLLLKPQTFMNLSGETMRSLFSEAQHFRQIPLTVVHDELDLPVGKVRIKKGGSDAGHNGLASLRSHLGHGEFCRVRIGIGRPEPGSHIDVPAWVLKKFEHSEEESLIDSLSLAIQGIESLVKNPENVQLAQTLVSKNFSKDKKE
jgi:PTH1 family peptidyl-tRNA hydrolase